MSEEDYAEAWRPEEGDKIAGRVMAVTMGPDMGYGPYPIITLDVQGTERAVHAFHSVLRTELARRRPGPGDDLEIVYQGQRKPKSGVGNPFHVYRVRGGKEPEFNWDAELPPEERSQRQAQSAEPAIAPSQPFSQPSPPPPVQSSGGSSIQERAAERFESEPPF